jgi:hypothetical protein
MLRLGQPQRDDRQVDTPDHGHHRHVDVPEPVIVKWLARHLGQVGRKAVRHFTGQG